MFAAREADTTLCMRWLLQPSGTGSKRCAKAIQTEEMCVCALGLQPGHGQSPNAKRIQVQLLSCGIRTSHVTNGSFPSKAVLP
jgi:hypothetical protein